MARTTIRSHVIGEKYHNLESGDPLGAFPHLPVTDFVGCTRNFETLLPLLNASEESGGRGRGSSESVGAWTALTLGPKIEAGAAVQSIRVRREGPNTRLRGVPVVKAGETLTAGETLATLPAGFRPPGRVIVSTNTSASTATYMLIETTGVITLQNNLTAGNFVFFDSVTFNLT